MMAVWLAIVVFAERLNFSGFSQLEEFRLKSWTSNRPSGGV